MSADLERLVRKKRAELKAQSKKMAEFENNQGISPNKMLAQNVKLEKQKMKASNKVMQELKHKN